MATSTPLTIYTHTQRKGWEEIISLSAPRDIPIALPSPSEFLIKSYERPPTTVLPQFWLNLPDGMDGGKLKEWLTYLATGSKSGPKV